MVTVEGTIRRMTLPKAERLSGRNAVDSLFRDGSGGFVYPFRYIYTIVSTDSGMPPAEAPARILFSVPKRYHKRANKRNLLKRRSREAYRQAKFPLADKLSGTGKNIHVALIYSSKGIEPYNKINNAIRRIISEIHDRL